MHRRLAIVRDSQELAAALRARAEELQLSRRELDRLAGLADGYAAKLLCDPPVRRMAPESLFLLAGALGVRITLSRDSAMVKCLRWADPRDSSRVRSGTEHWRNAKALGIVREMMIKHASRGGLAAFAKMTAEQLTTHQSRAARARWKKRKLRATTVPSPPP